MGYPKHIYQKAGEELERRRAEARRLQNARAEEIASKIPEVTRISREMAETAMAVTRLVIASPNDAGERLRELRDKNLKLQEERAALLAGAGYPKDYLAEIKPCDECGGKGYVGSRMCGCFRELLTSGAYAELSAVSQLKKSSFSDFDLGLYPEKGGAKSESPRKHMTGVLDICKSYAGKFTPDSESLLMIGHTGLGKTHLSLAIAGEVTERGFGVVYTPVQRLTDKLESSKFSYAQESKEQYARDVEDVLTCDLLILDDLGAEFITQFSAAMLYNIVNTRLVENRSTIVSTNLEPGEIEAKYTPRMLSRLMGGYRAIKFMGRDVRFEKKIKR